MHITTKRLHRVDLIAVEGRVDAATAPELEQAFRSILAQERFRLVFDMSKVDFISSAGLKVLLSVQKEAKKWNRGELRLAAMSPHLVETLEMVGLIPLFKCFENDVEAVGSF
jgi:anti-sigma B factor antagonist